MELQRTCKPGTHAHANPSESKDYRGTMPHLEEKLLARCVQTMREAGNVPGRELGLADSTAATTPAPPRSTEDALMDTWPADTSDLDHADGDALLSDPVRDAGAPTTTTAVDDLMDLADAERKMAQAELHARQLEARIRSMCEAEATLRANNDQVLAGHDSAGVTDEVGRECARRSCTALQETAADLCSNDPW